MAIWTGKRTLVFGDSLAGGLGPRLGPIIAADGGTALPYVSRVGWSTNRFVQASDWNMSGVDLAVIVLGTNDDPASFNSYTTVLNSFVNRVRSYGVPEIAWIGPPTVLHSDISARVQKVASWQGQVLPGLGVNWVDSRLVARSDAGDKVHLTGKGYAAWASAAAGQLNSGVLGSLLTPPNIIAVGIFGGILYWLLQPPKPQASA